MIGKDTEPSLAMKKAVALKYTPGENDAPVVTAKGQGKLAETILERAKEHGVPVQEDAALVEVLSKLDLDQQIPPELYQLRGGSADLCLSGGRSGQGREGSVMKSSAGEGKITRKQKGAAAEDAAVACLKGKGLRILDRNWRCRTGELDIIAEHEGVLVIVEVRSRSGTGAFGTPSESVDLRKMAQVRNTALQYIHLKKYHDRPIRFDVVAVMLNADLTPASIEHISNAF